MAAGRGELDTIIYESPITGTAYSIYDLCRTAACDGALPACLAAMASAGEIG